MAASTIGGQVGGAIDDRAPSFFGLLLICVGLLAAYGLVTGNLQAAWAALTGTAQAATPAASSSSASAAGSGASTAGQVGQSSIGSYASSPSLGSGASFASDYVAPNISQPQVVAATIPVNASSAQVPLNGAPSISTPANIYGALAA